VVAAYGPYSASATGGNSFCRDFLAGIAALYATPFYTSIAEGTKWQLPAPSLILSGIAALGVIPVFYFYFNGEKARNKSKYARELAEKRAEKKAEREVAEKEAPSPTASAAETAVASARGSSEMVQSKAIPTIAVSEV